MQSPSSVLNVSYWKCKFWNGWFSVSYNIVNIASLNMCFDLCCISIPPSQVSCQITCYTAQSNQMSGHDIQKIKVHTLTSKHMCRKPICTSQFLTFIKHIYMPHPTRLHIVYTYFTWYHVLYVMSDYTLYTATIIWVPFLVYMPTV